MSWNKNNILNESNEGDWGGPWTERKLLAFSKYVWSYLTIMKKFPFWETIYFDGFAGSGTRGKEIQSELYKQLEITEQEERTYKGAAERVLKLQDGLRFNYYYFIDKETKSLDELADKLKSYEGKRLIFRSGDMNKHMEDLAEALHNKQKKLAALIFLDPFGMQITWNSIEKLKNTRSDVWILIPTGVIVNRLLDKAGKLKFSSKLESFFGLNIEEIKLFFYEQKKQQTLFGEEETITKVSKPIEKIAKLYATRMQSIWKYVTEKPLRLDNRNGVPLFHFVFASNNENALKIANQIIQSI